VINLEVNVDSPLTPKSIASAGDCTLLLAKSVAGAPPEETTQELYDVAVFPPFVKCHMPPFIFHST